MIYIQNVKDLNIEKPTIVSLGKFDGLHTGHKLLMDHLHTGHEQGLQSVAFTFDIPPRAMEAADYRVLSTQREKEMIFRQVGVDYLIECPFTNEFKSMEPEEFLKLLSKRLHVKKIVSGTDFRFGYKARGDYQMLQEYAHILGYEVEIVDKIQYHGQDISSTWIRELVMKGDMETANKLLGYSYFLLETVIEGNQLGRTVDIPTANLLPEPEKLLPPNGVYVSEVCIDGVTYHGISNIGCKPTVGGGNPIGVEMYIFDFHENIYGKEIAVSFLKFLRPEKKFPDFEHLIHQMKQDIASAKRYFR